MLCHTKTSRLSCLREFDSYSDNHVYCSKACRTAGGIDVQRAKRVPDVLACIRKTVSEALKEWIREFSPVLKRVTISTYYRMIVLLPKAQVVSELTERNAERLYLDQIERISEHTGRLQ